MIATRGLSIMAGQRRLLDEVEVMIAPGRVTVLLGPNGAGKSTLISALAGERRPDGGGVTLDDRAMADWSPLDLARRRAVLLQSAALDFAFTVEEVVELGRLPFAGTPGALDDAAAMAAACRMTGIDAFRHRSYQTLSGGEKQRVQFARAIAQIWRRDAGDGLPRYLLLDEPTSALDLRHQRSILDVARRLADDGVGVLAAIHDLNLAIDYADEAILLREGRVLTSGPVHKVMTGERLGDCFDVPVEILTREDGRRAIFT